MSNWYKIRYVMWGQELETIILADGIDMVKDRLHLSNDQILSYKVI